MRASFALRCGDLFKKQDTFPDSSNVIDAMNSCTNIKIKSDAVSVLLRVHFDVALSIVAGETGEW